MTWGEGWMEAERRLQEGPSSSFPSCRVPLQQLRVSTRPVQSLVTQRLAFTWKQDVRSHVWRGVAGLRELHSGSLTLGNLQSDAMALEPCPVQTGGF